MKNSILRSDDTDTKLIELLTKAKTSPDEDRYMAQFLKAMSETGEAQRVAIKYRNRDLDRNEVEAVWYTEMALAAQEASLAIGNPIHFIRWRALKRTLSFIRDFHRQNLVVDCLDCQTTGQNLLMVRKTIVCSKCGSDKVRTDRRNFQIHRSPSATEAPFEFTLSRYTKDEVIEMAGHSITIEEMRAYLVKRSGVQSSRVVELFDAMVEFEDVSYVVKVLQERWGTSRSAVWQAMMKLRVRLTDFIQKESES